MTNRGCRSPKSRLRNCDRESYTKLSDYRNVPIGSTIEPILPNGQKAAIHKTDAIAMYTPTNMLPICTNTNRSALSPNESLLGGPANGPIQTQHGGTGSVRIEKQVLLQTYSGDRTAATSTSVDWRRIRDSKNVTLTGPRHQARYITGSCSEAHEQAFADSQHGASGPGKRVPVTRY
jgi:hypothetical protein